MSQRDEFEKWWKIARERECDGMQARDLVAWQAWQASRAAALEEAARAVEKHDVAGREWIKDSLWGALTGECVRRIRALANPEGAN